MNFLGKDLLFVNFIFNYICIYYILFRIAQRLFEFLNQIFEYVSSRAKSCSGLCVYIFENFFFVCLLFSVFWINCFFTFYFQYIHFDMARSRKRDDTKDNDTIVMAKLAEIGNLSWILGTVFIITKIS